MPWIFYDLLISKHELYEQKHTQLYREGMRLTVGNAV